MRGLFYQPLISLVIADATRLADVRSIRFTAVDSRTRAGLPLSSYNAEHVAPNVLHVTVPTGFLIAIEDALPSFDMLAATLNTGSPQIDTTHRFPLTGLVEAHQNLEACVRGRSQLGPG